MMLSLVLAASSALLAAQVKGQPSGSSDVDVIASWVQYAKTSSEAKYAQAEVRAILDGDTECPDDLLEVNGKHLKMSVRATNTTDHHDTVCTAFLPDRGINSIYLNGESLPVPKRNPHRIVVVGDTGCRLSDSHGFYQECNNPSLWPFEMVANSIAAAGPDVIIYTGDYIYREAECPDGDKGCEGSPVGDNLGVWKVDWIYPSAAIRKAAPIVFVRGNHETCIRAGVGFFRYLHGGLEDDSSSCTVSSAPYIVDFKSLQVGVMDGGSQKIEGESLAPLFAKQLKDLESWFSDSKTSWIVDHYPFFGFGADDDDVSGEEPGISISPANQAAVKLNGGKLPHTTRLLVGSHIHMAELISFKRSNGSDSGSGKKRSKTSKFSKTVRARSKSGKKKSKASKSSKALRAKQMTAAGDYRPTQLVVGNGGTQLVAPVEIPPTIDGFMVDETMTLYQYGSVLMQRKDKYSKKWSVEFLDIDGRTLEKCYLEDKQTSCEK